MNPVFPSELRNYFLQHDPNEDEEKLTDFFAQYPIVKQTFLEWAECHKQTLEYTPRLYNALDLSWGYDLSMERTLIVAANITRNIYLKLTNQDNESKIINRILDNPKIEVLYKCTGNNLFTKEIDDRNKLIAKQKTYCG